MVIKHVMILIVVIQTKQTLFTEYLKLQACTKITDLYLKLDVHIVEEIYAGHKKPI